MGNSFINCPCDQLEIHYWARNIGFSSQLYFSVPHENVTNPVSKEGNKSKLNDCYADASLQMR